VPHREVAARSRRCRCGADSVAPNQCRPTEPVDRSHPCTAALDYSRDPVWPSPVKPVASSSIPISSFVASVRAPGALARNDQLSPAGSHAANTLSPIVRHDRRWFACLVADPRGRSWSWRLSLCAPPLATRRAGARPRRSLGSGRPSSSRSPAPVAAAPSSSRARPCRSRPPPPPVPSCYPNRGASVLNKLDRHGDASEMLDCTRESVSMQSVLSSADIFCCYYIDLLQLARTRMLQMVPRRPQQQRGSRQRLPSQRRPRRCRCQR